MRVLLEHELHSFLNLPEQKKSLNKIRTKTVTQTYGGMIKHQTKKIVERTIFQV